MNKNHVFTKLVFHDARIVRLDQSTAEITGYVRKEKPNVADGSSRREEPISKPQQTVLRTVKPDEPNSEIEVGYSPNALKPLSLVFKDREITLSLNLFVLFRYMYDLYRAEGQTEFGFAEISEAIADDELKMTRRSLERLVERLTVFFRSNNESIRQMQQKTVPIFLFCANTVVPYPHDNNRAFFFIEPIKFYHPSLEFTS